MKMQFKLPVILDGGMGRELERMGAPFQQPQWSAQALMQAPHFVSEAHRNFIAAGAEIITTNTYALVPFHLGEQCFNAQGAQLIKLAAQLARQCADESSVKNPDKSTDKNSGVLVAGCIPPVLGSYRPDLFAVNQAKPLVELMINNQATEVDFWLAETISSIAEAALIKACTAGTNKTSWIAFTVTDQVEIEPTLRSGESVYSAVSEIAGQNVTAILFNCSRPEVMTAALLSAKRAIAAQGLADNVQLGVYANSFAVIDDDHQANDGVCAIRADNTPQKYRELAATWINAGASIVGGCCGISPEHIKQLGELK